MSMKTKAKVVLGVVVVAAAVAVALKAQAEVQKRREAASQAMTNIQSELDGLDAVSRAAVVAKLGADEVTRSRPNG